MTELSLHTIKSARGARKKAFAIGRGEGSGLGKTSGRGTKGQRARSGGKRGLALKGMRRVVLRIPKVRGFKSHASRLETITLADLERWFSAGARVTVAGLKKAKHISVRAGGANVVKTGVLTKALMLSGVSATPGAKVEIEKTGGSVEVESRAKSKRTK